MIATPSDTELLARIADGDRDAFEQLLKRHINPLYRYAIRLCGSAATADDLLQDVWLSVWRKAAQYNPKRGEATTWLHRVLHNAFITTQRRRHIFGDDLASIEEAADETSSKDPIEQRQQRQAVRAALSRLPINQRAAIALTHSQNFSSAEGAAIMGIGLRAYESLLARGRRALRTALSDVHPGEMNGH